jgi:hypothetical protein
MISTEVSSSATHIKCQKFGLKLHASKSMFFATTVRYCGRLITKDGVRFDPKNMEALQTMRKALWRRRARHADAWRDAGLSRRARRAAALWVTGAVMARGGSRGGICGRVVRRRAAWCLWARLASTGAGLAGAVLARLALII